MKKVLVLGAGISGRGAAHVLNKMGCDVVVSDLADRLGSRKKPLEEEGVQFCFGPQGDVLLDGMDAVVVSPAVPAENPIVRGAFKRHIPVLSEIEIAYRVAKAPILGVTGTNGKTTTTTLLGLMIKEAGIPCAVAGNIGASLSLEVEHVPANGLIAAELSSFQLEFIDTFRPAAAVILNITPDHMERHHTMEAYAAAKARIFENMTMDNCILLNAADPYTPQLKEQAEKHTRVFLLDKENEVEQGAFVKNGTLTLRVDGKEVSICQVSDMKIYGPQNVEDALAASFLAFVGGVSVDHIRSVLLSFKGLEHRIEPVRTLDGVRYVNDSKATNVDATLKALDAFTDPVILIAGGHDKETPIDDFMAYVRDHTKHLILMGEASGRFLKEARKAGITSVELAMDMKEAVEKARSAAKPGDVVLLSPACSSFDMYSCFEERGEDFKNIVRDLK